MKLSRLDKLFRPKDNVAKQLMAEAVLGFLIKKNMTGVGDLAIHTVLVHEGSIGLLLA